MDNVVIRDARRDDAVVLAADLRPQDRAELEAAHGRHVDIIAVLEYAIERSTPDAWVMYVAGRLWMMGGVAAAGTLLGGAAGTPWILCSTAMLSKPGVLTRNALRYLRIVKGQYPELSNYVDARNTKAIRWIRRMGFSLDAETIPMGPDAMPFYRFWMKD